MQQTFIEYKKRTFIGLEQWFRKSNFFYNKQRTFQKITDNKSSLENDNQESSKMDSTRSLKCCHP